MMIDWVIDLLLFNLQLAYCMRKTIQLNTKFQVMKFINEGTYPTDEGSVKYSVQLNNICLYLIKIESIIRHALSKPIDWLESVHVSGLVVKKKKKIDKCILALNK